MADLPASLAEGYGFDDDAVVLGRPLTGDLSVPLHDVFVQAPLSGLNKHGLVAGATGTGKTKTLQLIAEQLSDAGIPVFLADVKGDLTGLAEPSRGGERIDQRMSDLDLPWTASAYPVELLSLTGSAGPPVRTTVSDLGPLLLSRILDLNDTQAGVLQVAFRFADEGGLLLLDLEDLTALLRFLSSDDAAEDRERYGGMASSTLGVILRKTMELESQGAEGLLGEPVFDVADLLRTAPDGRGTITLLELADVQDRPRLFSTFLMWLLAELFEHLPELGDPGRPELVFFFDEAHLLFEGAPRPLLAAIEQTVRMVRSKGVGVFFVTQQPKDVPQDVLAQLGNRVQHALRAYTPQDAKTLRATAGTFPTTDHYDVEEVLTGLGVGEALVTFLGPDGRPTPTAATRMVAPRSSMDAAAPQTVQRLVSDSSLAGRYAVEVDRESAAEQLAARARQRVEAAEARGEEDVRVGGSEPPGGTRRTPFESFARSAASAVGREVGRQLIRGLLGNLRR